MSVYGGLFCQEFYLPIAALLPKLVAQTPQVFLTRMGNVVNIIVGDDAGLSATNCARNWIDGG
jgi:hypothetical protein